MRRNWVRGIVGSILALAMTTPGQGTSARVRFDAQLPHALKPRVEAMIRSLRPLDAEEAIKNIKTLPGTKENTDHIFVRVETNCSEDLCMIVLADNSSADLEPKFIVNAGDGIVGGDAQIRLWSGRAWYISFPGANGSTITALTHGSKWVFTSCKSCISWGKAEVDSAPGRAISELERRTLPSISFKDFRTSIGRKD